MLKCFDVLSHTKQKEEDFHLAVDYMKETYGSILGYVTDGLGVTEEEIEILRDRCLE